MLNKQTNKNAMTEMKISIESFNNKLEQSQDRNSVEDRSCEFTQSEKQKRKRMKKS